jgi:LysR family glycine cleavage system transcriptional activator
MAVRAFESAARLGSFTAAADELLLTQSAISRHVRNLERSVGIDLFHRRGRHVALTADGRRYMEVATDAFDRISAATAALRHSRHAQTLTISMAPSLASRWFASRIASLLDVCPGIEVRVRTSCRFADFDNDEFDVAILYGSGNWPGLDVEWLITEEVFPVCSPGYLKVDCGPADLEKVTLLHGDLREDWRTWLQAAGRPVPDLLHGPRFDDDVSLLQAATDGLGIALGRTLTVEKDLREGRLVAPFDTVIQSDSAYWLITSMGRGRHPLFDVFRRWTLGQIKEANLVRPRRAAA